MLQTDYIIHGDYVLTMNDNLEVIRDGALAIKGAKIIAVDNKENIFNRYTANKILDKKGHVLLPGLVNTHCHAPMTYLRGIADDLPLHEWLEKHIWPKETKWLSPAFVYDATKLTCLEMLKGGITTFADMYFFCDEMAKAVKEVGLRGILAPTIFDFPSAAAKTSDEYFNSAEEFIKNWRNDELITPSIGPHAPYTCGIDTLKRTQKFAEKFDILIQTHLAETKQEETEIKKKYGATPTKHLASIGLLDARVLAAHCVFVNDEDIAILKDKKISVSHCIESNLKLASGFAPIAKMLKSGITVSFGTDGAASNNDLDLLQEIATAAKIHKALEKDPTFLNAKTALFMATKGGAKALNMEDKIGCLEPNFFADIIAINLEKPHLLPIYDLYSQIIYAAKSADITTVINNGRLLLDEGKFSPNVSGNENSEEAILAKAKEWGEKIKDAK